MSIVLGTRAIHFVARRSVEMLTVASVAFGLLGVARAVSVDSGFVQWTPDLEVAGFGTTTWQLYAAVWFDNVSTTEQITNVGITQASLSLPPGWIGVAVEGFRDGGFCGRSDNIYNTTDSTYAVVGHALCRNPSGFQTFRTDTDAFIWDGVGSYSYRGWQLSPNASR
jgi:hypothetical protein